MRGDLMRAALRNRIRGSDTVLEIEYPEARPVVNTGNPTVAPVSPLTGPKPTVSLVPAAVTPEEATTAQIKCLWLDAISATTQDRGQIADTSGKVAWKQDAEIMARVLVEDAAIDPEAPYGATIFDGANMVLAVGKRWKVLGVEAISSSFRTPFTYAVWLAGATRE